MQIILFIILVIVLLVLWLFAVATKVNEKWNCTNAIIPKGSKYYIGENGDIVSNQMMITGRYKDKD